MPNLQRSACRTRIRTMLYEPTARYFSDDEINTWINDAVRDISIKTMCSQKIVTTGIVTTSGVSTYAYPTEMGTTAIVTIGIKAIVTSANVSLSQVTPQLIGRVGDEGETNWVDWGRQITFTPVPQTSSTYIPYIWVEERCTADSTDLAIPTALHHLVPLYGTYKGHEKRGRFQLAQSIYSQYETEMKRVSETIMDKFGIVEPNMSKLQTPQID